MWSAATSWQHDDCDAFAATHLSPSRFLQLRQRHLANGHRAHNDLRD
jgi:hypothetical protein